MLMGSMALPSILCLSSPCSKIGAVSRRPQGLAQNRCTYARPRPSSSLRATEKEKNEFELPPNLAAPSAEFQEDDTSSTAAPSTSSSSPSLASPSTIPYPLVAGISGAGVLETAYLTWVKLTNSAVVCPVSGCDSVLSSSYSELFGVPLSLFGMLTYGAVSAAALAAAAQPSSSGRGTLDAALATGTSLLAGVSGFLIYLLQKEFSGQPCAWCYLSATLSLSLMATVVSGLPARRLQQVAIPSLGALASTVAVLYFNTASVGSSTAANYQLPYSEPVVTTSSSEQAIALATRLRDAGAKMYGAFWCSHCLDQKQEFGKEAMATFPYVECYPNGWERGVKYAEACNEARVTAFPTWVINGTVVEGELTFDEVDKLLKGKPIPE